jgi:phosphoglycolate phosphatase-like HAD superfamily hydrolase
MPLPSPRRYDAVFFDLDDTLTITRRTKFDMHKTIARERYGRTFTDDEIGRHYQKPIEQSLRDLYDEPDLPAHDLLAILDEYQSRFPHRLHDDALRVIEALLAANLDVGIITGSPEHLVMPVLTTLNVPIGKMAGVYCYNSDRLRKPDPAVFDDAIAALRARRGPGRLALLYVGDGLEDFRAARDAGVDFVAVTTGVVSGDEFRRAGASYVVDRLAEVLRAIRLPR